MSASAACGCKIRPPWDQLFECWSGRPGIKLAATQQMQPGLSDVLALLILAIPIAGVTWTITHEDILRELREYCADQSRCARSLVARKFFYGFTCEYCFSHWVALAAVGITGFGLLLDGWRG